MAWASALGMLKGAGEAATALGAIGNLFGGGNSNAAIGEQMRWQQEWQSEMAQTQWQKTVPDMIAAGINPMAAFHSGPNSTGSQGGTQQPIPKSLQRSQAMAAAANAMTSTAQLKNIDAQTDLIKTQTAATAKQAGLYEAQTANTQGQTGLLPTTGAKLEAETNYIKSQMERNTYEMRNLIANEALLKEKGLTEQSIRKLQDAHENLAQLDALLRSSDIGLREAQIRTEGIRQKMMHLEIPGLTNTAEWEQAMSTGEGNAVSGLAKIMQVLKLIFKR